MVKAIEHLKNGKVTGKNAITAKAWEVAQGTIGDKRFKLTWTFVHIKDSLEIILYERCVSLMHKGQKIYADILEICY